MGVDVLAQIHIPKCAGTAIHNWMLDSYYAGLSSGFAGLYGPEDLDEEALWSAALSGAHITLVSGHNIRTFPTHVHHRPMHYFTLLRNPRARLVSALRYMIQERAAYGVPPHVGDSIESIAHWLYAQSRPLVLECAQTNHLALYVWCASAPARCDPATYGNWAGDDHAAYQKERLDVAKGVLDGFLAVGVVERLAESAEILRRRSAALGIGLLPADKIKIINETDRAIDRDLSWIANGSNEARYLMRCADDEALYAYAEKLLDTAAYVSAASR